MRSPRFAVIGSSGSGKSTVARRIAERLNLPRLELDSVFWQPDWVSLEREEFRARVRAFLDEHEGWVIDGNYRVVQDLVWERATSVVWLDLPRCKSMAQLIPRTIRRLITRQELWNGNRERWSDFLSRDPDKSVIVYAWQQHPHYCAYYQGCLEDPRWSHLGFTRLQTRDEVERWLEDLGNPDPGRGLDSFAPRR